MSIVTTHSDAYGGVLAAGQANVTNGTFHVTALAAAASLNGLQVNVVDPGTPSHAFTAVRVGAVLTITLATSAGSAITSTLAAVQAAIDAQPDIVSSLAGGAAGADTAQAIAITLAGGVNTAPVLLAQADINGSVVYLGANSGYRIGPTATTAFTSAFAHIDGASIYLPAGEALYAIADVGQTKTASAMTVDGTEPARA